MTYEEKKAAEHAADLAKPFLQRQEWRKDHMYRGWMLEPVIQEPQEQADEEPAPNYLETDRDDQIMVHPVTGVDERTEENRRHFLAEYRQDHYLWKMGFDNLREYCAWAAGKTKEQIHDYEASHGCVDLDKELDAPEEDGYQFWTRIKGCKAQ
jgi:hypothetical protein